MREHMTRIEVIVQGNSSSIRLRGKEHHKAITLRSGKQTVESTTDSTIAPQDTGEVIPGENVESEELFDVPNNEVPQIVTYMPNVNIPLVDALVQILNYGKSIKELLFKKEKLNDMETIALTKGCSVVLTNKLPHKMKDLESFTIPCSTGNHYLDKALCDLGASINLMPLSTFQKLGIDNMKPTAVTLQLVD
ncbi:uncharacterized protein [Gossypium hirsutum]|uniref:Aspartic peptidase DDI1-type domain-containing protein n=1 Tax=Gossypium hirsutum TaxID=3635 RepID=A0A1U8PYQ0_GOSHI|nr:uncharacterized protein LOC107963351 [Gossypium hirsutum]